MNTKNDQKGSALIYILIAIALLAALTATFMDNSSQQTSSQSTFNTVTDLNSQINFIRSGIQECVLTFPSGDTSGTVTALENAPYPINPSSTYFPTSPSIRAANNNASGLRCPGNPGTSNQHSLIFGGTSGKFMPPAPKLFNNWQYYNGADGVFFWTSTDKTDSFLTNSLAKLDDQFSECEADVITGPYTMNTDTTPLTVSCPSGSTCFRVWLITRPTARYKDPVDDAACP